MEKFNRKYHLEVQTINGATIVIELPFTMEFDITRNSLSSANISQIRIYNLSERNRNLIRKDIFDYNDLRTIVLRAGYGTNLPVVFAGNVTVAWSVREGNNFITQIESFDGGYAYTNAIINQSFVGGTPQETILETMVDSMGPYGVKKGIIGNYSGTSAKGSSYSGSTTDILKDISGGGFFIDNGTAHCLQDDECIPGPIALIDSASGLLGTPVREQTYLNFDMIFEPNLIIGQKIELQSITGANFNGVHKVVSVKHKGTISEAVCGNAITSVGLFAPSVLKVLEQTVNK